MRGVSGGCVARCESTYLGSFDAGFYLHRGADEIRFSRLGDLCALHSDPQYHDPFPRDPSASCGDHLHGTHGGARRFPSQKEHRAPLDGDGI